MTGFRVTSASVTLGARTHDVSQLRKSTVSQVPLPRSSGAKQELSSVRPPGSRREPGAQHQPCRGINT